PSDIWSYGTYVDATLCHGWDWGRNGRPDFRSSNVIRPLKKDLLDHEAKKSVHPL
ncbi:17288_t:CDS:2, partial [Acaulospora colombiana]